MARRGGGGGGGLVSRHQGGSQPVTTQPKLPGRGGGGGPGRPNQHGMNPHQRRNLRQDRRQERRDAATVGGDPAAGVLSTGLGSTMMNDMESSQQGAMGLMNNLSPGGNVFQNSQQQMFANEQIGSLYDRYTGYKASNPGLENFTWSQYLGQQYGAGTEGQGLLNAIRAEWAKNQAKLRGGIAQGYYGSGRTITG